MATKIDKDTSGTNTAASKFMLPDKKVTLIPVVREKSFMGVPDHDGLFMYTGTSQTWSIFRTSDGKYVDPLNATERVFLEKELGEDLNLNHKTNYWQEFEVKITKDVHELDQLKKVFNLKDPKDFLAYKLLLTAPDVANSIQEKDDTYEYRWVLVEKDEDIQGRLKTGKMKSFCYNWVNENQDKTSNLKDVLYVLSIGINVDASRDELENAIIDIIESSRLSQLYEILTDENLETNIFLTKALKSREIVIRKFKYYDTDGELLAATKDQMREWIADPENSMKVAAMRKTIEKYKL